ncbi:MAG: GGDEF domain-containing protein [Campylobacterales bacterium]|nr:GGDEF domain-containing protein [Campylobacterales bacterium]
MNQELQELTDDTIREIRKLEIVLPEIYRDVFYTMAQKRNITINEDDKEEALTYALAKIQKLSKEAQKSAHQLQEHVAQAKEAVENKDSEALHTIHDDLMTLEKKIKRLQHEIYLDSLTGMFNRRWLFEKFLDQDTFTCRGAFAFLDINDFKSINDNYGHTTGDKVLKVLAVVLQKMENVNVIRFAGDEFVVVSVVHSSEKLRHMLTTVYRNLKHTPLKTGDQKFLVSFSFGVSDFDKGDAFNDVYVEADALMYEDKAVHKARKV